MIAVGVLLVAALFVGISGADLFAQNLPPDDQADMGVELKQ